MDEELTVFKNNVDKIMTNPRSGNYKAQIIDTMYKSISNIVEIDQVISEAKAITKDQINQIFEIKKYLDVELMRKYRDVYSLTTSITSTSTDLNRGCDLRELFFKREISEISEINDMLINDASKNNRISLLKLFAKISTLMDGDFTNHILTDIDDTIFAHPDNKYAAWFQNVFPIVKNMAGSDYSWKTKSPYPGIETFYEQFYKTISDDEKKYSTILSATPGILKGNKFDDPHLKPISNSKSKNDFAFIQGIDGLRNAASMVVPGITEGEIATAAQGMRGQDGNKNEIYKLFGKIKYIRAKQYKALFPEYNLLFIGDNGQGDEYAGEDMIKDDIVNFVFIHKIINEPNGVNVKKCKEMCSSPEEKCKIKCFSTYRELAKIFEDIGIFNSEDGKAVEKKAKEEVCTSIDHPNTSVYNKDACNDRWNVEFGGKKSKKSRKKSRKQTKKMRKNKRRNTKKKKNKVIFSKTLEYQNYI